MRKHIIVLIFIFLSSGSLHAQLTVLGILDSTVSFTAGAGDAPDFSMGVEEFANIRFQAKREKFTVYGAVNLLAATGDYANYAAVLADSKSGYLLAYTSYVAGDNYVAGIELERLYFRLSSEYTNFDGGLMRLPFGYSQVWGSSDFLNPKNPLKPDARPRGILSAAFSWFPIDELKLLVFFSAPRDPFSADGGGSLAGISLDRHYDKLSIQSLYSFETPNTGSESGLHRIGLSIKADFKAALIFDALYTYNQEAQTAHNGLSFSFGADYSFFEGKLIALAEYLFNGGASSTALGYGGSFINTNYLYTGFTIVINDFTNLNIALISGLDDISFTPIISFSHDLFQGAALTITAQAPMDRDLFTGDGNKGELGPLRLGSYFNCSVRLRLRF
jgi:hypothetical protein